MVTTMGYGSREKTKAMHARIVSEYESLRELNRERKVKDILTHLAEKYGYSSGQAVRNMIRLYNKTKQN